MADYSKTIEDFLSFLRGCEQSYHMAEADEQDANSSTQDILHSLELEAHTYQEYARLGKELTGIRQLRRTAEDTMCQIEPILGWIEQNRSVIKGLERLLGAVRRAEKNTEGRIYTPRTKKQGEERKG